MALKPPAASRSVKRRRLGSIWRVVFVILLLPSMAALAQLAPAQLRDFRVGIWPDRLRLVLESEQRLAVEQRYSEGRVELYLSNVDAASLRHVLAKRPPDSHRLIRAYRLEARGQHDWMLTLDLAEAVQPDLLMLRPQSGFQHRVVLDLKFSAESVVGASQPLLTMVEPEPAIADLTPKPLPPLADPEPVASPSVPPSPVALRAVRLGRWPDRTRIVIETEQPVSFGVASTAPSDTVELRLSGLAASSLATALRQKVPPAHGLLLDSSVTAADAHAILTLNLSRHVTLRAFNLLPENGYGHRLVLDLLPAAALDTAARPSPHATPRVEATPALPPASVDPSAMPLPDLLWLEARLNQQKQRRTVLALRDHERLLLTSEDLRKWRLRVPEQADLQADGERWYRLDTLGIDYALDLPRMLLELTAPAALFAGADLEIPKRSVIEPTVSSLGGFLNYDLSATRSDGLVTDGGLFELGAFNAWGSATSTALWRRASAEASYRFLRLDTAFRRDDPVRMRSLTLGDAISRATAWSGAVRFGGVQWSRNFATQPEFLTLPMVGLSGEAALPSVLELYVNEALRMRQEIDPGPFSIGDIPVVTGQGEVRLVVRDALGREQILSQSFYAAQQLLGRGLHDWSWEVGAVRENFGIENFDYGRSMVSTTHRYGITDRLTGEAHAQWLQDQWMAGAGTVWQLPGGGLLQTAAAFSDSTQGRGQLYSVGAHRQGRWLSAGFETQFASDDFLRLGMRPDQSLPSRQQRAYASTRLPGGASLSVSWTEQLHRQQDDVAFMSVRFSRNLGQFGYFSLSALHYPESDENAISASVSIALGPSGTHVGLTAAHQDGQGRGAVQVQRGLPPGDGWGYQLRMGMGAQPSHQAGLSWQNQYGSWQLEGAHAGASLATRISASGGVGLLDGSPFLSRSIRDGFAVVRVPGFEGVRVYADNQEVGRTNAEGEVVVPRLRAYQRNRLRIEQADLPLGIRVQQVEREAVPYWRSGLTLDFLAASSRDAFFRIQLENGDPLPVGSALEWPQDQLWPVGYRGETFVTGLDPLSRLRARHTGGQCEFDLVVPESNEPLLDLGTVICREVAP